MVKNSSSKAKQRAAPERNNPFAVLGRPQKTGASAKTVAARTRRKPVAARQAASPPPAREKFVSASVLSREEKRQIILAHAKMHKPHDPVQIMSMWAGVAVCVAAVVLGWWWSVRPEIGTQFFHGVDSTKAQASESVTMAKQIVDEVSPDGILAPMKEAAAKLQDMRDQNLAKQQALKEIEALVESASTTQTAAGRDIFSPGAASGTGSIQ